jgi:hypothetical protein
MRLEACFVGRSAQIGEIEPVLTRHGRVGDLIVMTRFAPTAILA